MHELKQDLTLKVTNQDKQLHQIKT